MAGHSKWAKVKHFKGAVDAKRGKIFSKLSKEITIAAKIGGGGPNMNPRLRMALLKCRAANMPNENIERAIKKGTGGGETANFEDLTYEIYGPKVWRYWSKPARTTETARPRKSEALSAKMAERLPRRERSAVCFTAKAKSSFHAKPLTKIS